MTPPRSVAAIAAAVATGTLDPREVLAAAGAAHTASEAGDAPVSAFLATRFDTPKNAGAPLAGPLAGVPIAVKDNIATLELPTSCGSRILEGYHSPFEATVVRRLREAGGVVVGKTNMDEFGMGSSTEYSAYGPTRNPLDRTRVPGGSSGGSAAAVAAGIVPAALGSETGGSVRQPAAFCGTVGIKPTYGRVSRYGLVAYASSLDQVGTFGRTVDDAAALLEIVAGHDPLDSTSSDRRVEPFTSTRADDDSLEGIVVGVAEEYFPEGLDPAVREHCRAALAALESLGVELREVSLPATPHAIPTYYILAPAEASANLARYDGVRYGVRAPGAADLNELYDRTRALFGPEVKRRIMLGTYVLSAGYYDAYYGRAQRVRRLIAQDFDHVFASGVDLLFTPTAPSTAFRIGERLDDPYDMYLSDSFTVAANLAGVPALSLPIGAMDGLPIGGQLIGDHFDEATMIRVARLLERRLATNGAAADLPPVQR